MAYEAIFNKKHVVHCSYYKIKEHMFKILWNNSYNKEHRIQGLVDVHVSGCKGSLLTYRQLNDIPNGKRFGELGSIKFFPYNCQDKIIGHKFVDLAFWNNDEFNHPYIPDEFCRWPTFKYGTYDKNFIRRSAEIKINERSNITYS